MAAHALTHSLASKSWWKAAFIRAVRTALVVAVPYVPASYVGAVPYLAIASAAGLGFILSILTSLTGLSEADGAKQAYWVAILERVVKTVAQALIAGIGTAVFITDVNWDNLLQMALTAGFGSLLLAVLNQLPEADAPAVGTTVIQNNYGAPVEASVSLVDTAASSAVTTPATEEADRIE